MEDKQMRRAGLDYHEYTRVLRHANWQALLDSEQPRPERMFAMTTRGSGSVYDAHFEAGDWLVFGSETQGLQPELRDTFAPAQRLRLPMLAGQRSLNLSNAVAVTVFEAWRQHGFATANSSAPLMPMAPTCGPGSPSGQRAHHLIEITLPLKADARPV
jgi:tRNA (cytidine/uridine-2'-O-)-methyltransferase